MLQWRIRAHGDSSGVARWLLIFALTAGVVAVHVFGHSVDHGDRMPQMVTAKSAAIAPTVMPHNREPRATDTGRKRTAGAPTSDGMDPSTVCLAVLIAALLLPALRRTALWAPLPSSRLRAVVSERFSGLPPPWIPSLQDLSVLRL